MKKIKTTIVFTALLSLGFANFSCAVERQDSLKYWCKRGKIALGGAASLVGFSSFLLALGVCTKEICSIIKEGKKINYVKVLLSLGTYSSGLLMSGWLGLNSLETLHEVYGSASSQKIQKKPEESLKSSARQNKK